MVDAGRRANTTTGLDKFGKHIHGGFSVSSIRGMHCFLGFFSTDVVIVSIVAYVLRLVRNLPFSVLR